MKCREIIECLEQLAPLSYACQWDNPGLLVGREDKRIERALIALDATDQVIAQAKQEEVQLIVTHHPLIFHPLKQINDRDFISRRILELIQADICCYAMHTNFDSAPGGMADLAAQRIGLLTEGALEETGLADGKPVGIGRVGHLPSPLTAEQLACQVKTAFGLPFVTVYGLEQRRDPVTRVAICPGSGGSEIRRAVESGVQVLITGDIGHHDGIDAAACGMAVIDGGHYGLEHIFISFIANYLRQGWGEQLEIFQAKEAFPARMF